MGYNVNQMFPSNYISAPDLHGNTVDVVIERVAPELIGTDNKYVLYFLGKQKGLVLNKINCTTISSIYGPETDNWTGQPITLFPSQTEFQGKAVACIRVRLQAPGNGQRAAEAAPPPMPPPQHEPVEESKIPF